MKRYLIKITTINQETNFTIVCYLAKKGELSPAFNKKDEKYIFTHKEGFSQKYYALLQIKEWQRVLELYAYSYKKINDFQDLDNDLYLNTYEIVEVEQ